MTDTATQVRAERPRGPGAAPTAGSVLSSSFRERRSEFWRLAAWSAVEALPALLSGLLVARAIDDGFLRDQLWTGFGWLGLFAVSVVVGAWGTRQTMRRLADVVEPFRDDLVTRVVSDALRRSTILLGRHPAGSEVARLTQQVEIVREAYAGVLLVLGQFLFATLGAVIGMAALAAPIVPILVAPFVLSLIAFTFVLKGMARQQRASILADERISETGTTIVSGLRDIAACGGRDLARSAVGRHIVEAQVATSAVSRLTAVATLIVSVGGWAPLILIAALAPWLIDRGATVGVLLGAATYALQALQPALQTLVDGLSGPGLWLMITLRRIIEAGAATRDMQTHSGVDGPPGDGYELSLTGVSFAYSAWADPVVQELTLTVPEGDHLAVVGPSGIGKSTLAGLMTGMLEPTVGRVTIGGVAPSTQSTQQLAKSRVLIPQEAYVFDGTLRENLTYEHPSAVDAVVSRAVRLLGAEPLVRQLGGYAATVDPLSLSAGERQLITLVRAYVSQAPIVILDEATCHLDPLAEARVEDAFAQRPGTMVVIAHRMSSALRASRVLVLDGTAPMLGAHEELLRRSELYQDLLGRWNVADMPQVVDTHRN